MAPPNEQLTVDATLPDDKMEIPKAMDQAASYLAQASNYPPMSLEAEKRLVRKMDWILVPMVCEMVTSG